MDPNLRAGFLSALESFTNEVFGDNVNVVSLASFKLVCYSEEISLPGSKEKNKDSLLCYAIIEKETSDPDTIKKLLRRITSLFLNRYSLHDIFFKDKKKAKYHKFNKRIDDTLGDLSLKTEDRFRSIL
ncbi:MAG: hypothetical protein ACOC44_04860 [Promethearchaeia archaeon]